MNDDQNLSKQARTSLHLLFAASGAAALVYQVLWLRELVAVFGATAEAAAAILAAFFLGLALGSEVLGRLADRTPRPLRLYAILELAIALAAAPVPLILPLYQSAYGDLYPTLSGTPVLFTLFKMALTATVLLPATFFMGGTLPAVGRALSGDRGSLGRQGGRLYAANIVGAVLGTLLAAFGLPLWLGVRGSYVLAIALSICTAGGAAWLARGEPRREPVLGGAAPESDAVAIGPSAGRLLAVAFGSGFATIGLEVLWTRMLALVLQNSVYSFGSVVAVFLAGLALSAALVAWLLRSVPATRILRLSLLFSGPLILLTPGLLMWFSDGLQPYDAAAGFLSYSLSVVGLAAAVILPPVIAAGMVLPCVWELWRGRRGAGSRFGRPVALNTLGAIAGSLVAGFILLPTLGLGESIAAIGALYILMGELALRRTFVPRRGGWERAVIYPAALLVMMLASPTSLPMASLAPNERLLWSEEGPRGAVAVVERDGDRRLKLDNHYAIGGTAVVVEERRQGHLPILLHPSPRKVAFIGLGSGITAGAPLAHPDVERIVALELVPEVIDAAREYFGTWNAGVVTAPRAEVLVEDGRTYLAGTQERFDVIVGDLFVPWREGVGGLYSREHFENVNARLEPGGLFAQWLPLWQLSRQEFEIITATFLSVFDTVSLWRGVFSPDGASLALIGHKGGRAIDMESLARRLAALHERNPYPDPFLSELTGFMILYAGDARGLSETLRDVELNTENRPRMEWLAPRTQRAVLRGDATWMTGRPLAEAYETINRQGELPADEMLRGGPLAPGVYRQAGALFYRAELAAAAGEPRQAVLLRRRAYAALGMARGP
jgi:spermidine synthase